MERFSIKHTTLFNFKDICGLETSYSEPQVPFPAFQKIVGVICFFLLSFTLYAQTHKNTALAIISTSDLRYRNITSGHILFFFNAKNKLDIDISEKDTSTKFGTFEFYRSQGNVTYIFNIYGGKKYIYFNDTCYEIDSVNRNFKAKQSQQNPFWPLGVHNLNLLSVLIDTGIVINRWTENIKDPAFNVYLLPDTLINKNTCSVIKIEREDSAAEFKELFSPSFRKKLYISKKDSVIVKQHHEKVEFGFDFYWNEEISLYKLNNYTFEKLNEKAKRTFHQYTKQGIVAWVKPEGQLNNNQSPKPVLNEGLYAPNWKFPIYNSTGDSVELYKINTKYILLDFWYASCAPCLQDIPYIKRYVEKYGSKGLAVYGLNVYDTATSRIRAIDAKYHFNYPILYNTRSVVENEYGFTAFPQALLLDSEKRILLIGGGRPIKPGPSKMDIILEKLFGE